MDDPGGPDDEITFGPLPAQTVNANLNGTSSYTLLPCVEAGGKWYVGSGSA